LVTARIPLALWKTIKEWRYLDQGVMLITLPWSS
jgi:hypothetical protein